VQRWLPTFFRPSICPEAIRYKWGCNFVEIKRAEAAGGSTKTPRDLQSAGRHTDDEGFGGYLSKKEIADSRALQGEFQVTKYGLIATPYCGDEEIARVANSYGRRVSAEEVHNNPPNAE